MTWLRRRLTSVRRDGDEGSVLVLALVFLMVFGSWLGIVLQFAATGQRITVSVRAEATSTYAGGDPQLADLGCAVHNIAAIPRTWVPTSPGSAE